MDGTKHTKMYSEFGTKKEAEDARKITMRELANGTYVVNDNVKVRDFLDYINRTLTIERQLGKELDRIPNSKKESMMKKELQLKTFSSRRVLPIPDYVV